MDVPWRREVEKVEKWSLTIEEVEARTGIPKATLYTWRSLGKIPEKCMVKVNGLLRFRPKETQEWISALPDAPRRPQGRR